MGPRTPSKEQQRRAVLARQTKRDLRDELDETKVALQEAKDALNDKTGEAYDEIATLQDALWEIRDWFDSVLVRKEPMRDPRKVLALVERELGL